jgi:chorismate mutase
VIGGLSRYSATMPSKPKSNRKPSTNKLRSEVSAPKPTSKSVAKRASDGSKGPEQSEAAATQAVTGAALYELRTRINAIDQQLVTLLNDRASLVVEVGRQKRLAGLPIYTPHREAEVLERAIRQQAPFPSERWKRSIAS